MSTTLTFLYLLSADRIHPHIAINYNYLIVSPRLRRFKPSRPIGKGEEEHTILFFL